MCFSRDKGPADSVLNTSMLMSSEEIWASDCSLYTDHREQRVMERDTRAAAVHPQVITLGLTAAA